MTLSVRNLGAGAVEFLLDRPERGNALSAELVEALTSAFDDVSADTAAVVLRGAGRHFCTGFDLSDLDSVTDADLLYRFVRIEMLLHRVYSAPFVTVALGSGRIMGAGADLFVACDRRIVADSARVSFPGAGFGLILGTGRLAHRVGLDRARRLARSGCTLSSEEAVSWGLASDRIADGQWESKVGAEIAEARRLDRLTVAALHRVGTDGCGIDDGDAALAALVRSAARPGLKSRIAAYRDRAKQVAGH